jgi:hypothetical protein
MELRALFGTAALAFGIAASANAVPITAGSQINITGFNVASISSTQVIFTADKASAGAETGDFLTHFGPCTSCITMTSLTYSPFTAQSVYSGVNGGFTTGFSITSQITAPTFTVVGGVTDITITDNGTASLGGFDPTPGIWTFTGNTIDGLTGSFSATVAIQPGPGGGVPEPASIAVLGVGLLGLGIFRRRQA